MTKMEYSRKESMEERLAKVGTSEHFTLEELIEFLFVNKTMDEYVVREGVRAACHCAKCAECSKLYELMRLISQTGEVYAQITEKINDLNDPGKADQKEQILEYIRYELDYFNTAVLFNIPST